MAKLREFINPSQMQCLRELCRSEEKQHFFDKLSEMAAMIDPMPQTYDTRDQGDEVKVFLHYYTSGCDWWIIEKDEDAPGSPGQHQAYGFAEIGNGPESGYISIVELLENNAELDLHFPPKT